MIATRESALVAILAIIGLAITSCGQPPAPAMSPPTVTKTIYVTVPPTPSGQSPSSTRPSSGQPRPSTTPKSKPTPSVTQTPPNPNYHPIAPDRLYNSPWYEGRHPVQLAYGCVDIAEDWYSPDARCDASTKQPGQLSGFHHGADIHLPVGTPIYAGVNGVVIGQDQPGTPGTAYGKHVFRIRYERSVTVNGKTQRVMTDVVIGHTSKNFVKPGDPVKKGQKIALSGKSGLASNDPPHVHLEIRPVGGSYKTATCPYAVIWPNQTVEHGPSCDDTSG